MNQTEFLTALEQELQLRGIPFSQADLLAFVAAPWPLIEDDPSVERWATEFVVAGHGATVA